LIDAIRNFDCSFKVDFDPYSPDCEDEYEVPLPGAPNIPSMGLEEGYLKLSKYPSCAFED
jgi:hypothetical protein